MFVKLFPLLFTISLVCLLSFFLPFFLPPSRQTNDIILVIFFSNFQGFTSLPWQKVGRIWLGLAGNHSSFKFFLFLPTSLSNPSLPFPCIRTIWHRFNCFNFFLFDLVCYYFISHSGFSKRNFWCKEHCSSSKIGKVTALWRYFYNRIEFS